MFSKHGPLDYIHSAIELPASHDIMDILVDVSDKEENKDCGLRVKACSGAIHGLPGRLALDYRTLRLSEE